MIEHSQRDVLQDEEGIVSVEYVIVLILVCIAGITAWVSWREAVQNDASTHYTQFGYPP